MTSTQPRAPRPEADLPQRRPAPTRAAALRRVLVCLAAGIAVAAALCAVLPVAEAALGGWAVAGAGFAAWTWLRLAGMGPEETAEYALREDPSRAGADVLLLVAALAAVGGMGVVLSTGSSGGAVGLTVAAVLASWVVVHTVYALRYARHYYEGEDGGMDTHQADGGKPDYWDFAYLAFTVGMTFQVSDTELTTRTMRRAVLKHALLSWLLGAVVVASVVNLVAGLGGGGGGGG